MMELKQTHYATAAGLKKMQEELAHLIATKRREIEARLEDAFSHGNISENLDYDDAKREQAIIETRIHELEDALNNIEIIDENSIDDDRVGIGNTVTVREEGSDSVGDTDTYRIVGVLEADPLAGLISHESPTALALLNAKVGETVTVSTPGGDIHYTIEAIE